MEIIITDIRDEINKFNSNYKDEFTMIIIIYTTKYRCGSEMFKRAADTLANEKSKISNSEIITKGIVQKRELIDIFASIEKENKKINEFHFIGHSGMYGPMFGTVQYPEQFSPYELKQMHIPFATEAKAYFHCCRSARWFAPFFSRQFKIETFGYSLYTTFSSDKIKFKRADKNSNTVYASGCIGRKSHGLIGTIKKYSGMVNLERMISFTNKENGIDPTYNSKVTELYDEVFKDIKVREDEWQWLQKHFPFDKKVDVLDIGCGNGSLLNEFSSKINSGIGLDVSKSMIEKARDLNKENKNLSFEVIDGPKLPVKDKSIDLVISLLSFRYLDWDPLMNEVKRILKPEGKILIVDMVAESPVISETPLFLKSKLKQIRQRLRNPLYIKKLNRLVNDPAWENMLKYNPIRSEHEMKWYLESRFPGKKVEKINIGISCRILAFDSGSIENVKDINLTYP